VSKFLPAKKIASVFLLGLILFLPRLAEAMLSMELTRGVSGAIPVAVVSFPGETPDISADVSQVIANDLSNSGRFAVKRGDASQPVSAYRSRGVDAVVYGKVEQTAPNRYRVTYSLRDTWRGKSPDAGAGLLLSGNFTGGAKGLRAIAHAISDKVYHQMTGTRGIFSTRLAYIVVQHPTGAPARYLLEVADQDGYNPQALLTSAEPIMSPAWSPDGKRIAYVSFEKKRASIYMQEVGTGARQKLSGFRGINGAPAFSPDGKKLALVLSKDGSPSIYLLDIASHKLTRLTHDWSINTEPAFSPDGKSIIFTSNRGGGPQIYQLNLASNHITRVTYDGDYNARASFAPDGRHVLMLNRTKGLFAIAVLDLDTGVLRELTSASGADSESPSVAPNGAMVLYGTLYQGRSVLAMSSVDARVQVRLPVREGDVQDPAWSPWFS